MPDTAKNALIMKIMNSWMMSTIEDEVSIELTPGMLQCLMVSNYNYHNKIIGD